MKLIDISTKKHQNIFAMVDDADFDKVNQWKWSAEKRRNGFYAFRMFKIGGKNKSVRMHRFIFGETEMDIDHRDENGLNNQRSNLRECTQAQNIRNVGKRRGNTSQYKGVCWSEKFQRWESHIKINNKGINLGCYDEEIYAAGAYNLAAIEMHGSFANINAGINFSQDEVNNHRTPPAIGENSCLSKITEAQALDILNSTTSLNEAAKKYNVSFQLISSIRRRKCWKHLVKTERQD